MKVIIVGGGPAGLAAAVALKKKGIDDLLILEREHRLGGILNQCIHDGFGLTRFGKNISGPEYAQSFIDQVQELGIETITDCTVINISADKVVTAVANGRFLQLQAHIRQRWVELLQRPAERQVHGVHRALALGRPELTGAAHK